MKKIVKAIAIGAILISSSAQAKVNSGDAKLDKYIHFLQKDWARINYNIADEDEKESQMEKLSSQAQAVTNEYPNYAEPKIWQAIITSTQAGIKGGLGALSLVKKSKKLLEAAQAIKPNALNGSAYTSLGSLYYKVPGWPIGFGSDKKARKNLETALTINPNGIDPNYFYGDFLYEEGEYAKANQVLNKALNAPARADRPLADEGRRKEIQTLLAKVQKKLR